MIPYYLQGKPLGTDYAQWLMECLKNPWLLSDKKTSKQNTTRPALVLSLGCLYQSERHNYESNLQCGETSQLRRALSNCDSY